MNPIIQLKRTTSVFLIAFGLACFGLLPKAQAVLPSPTPDGGYPGGNTAEGENALFNLTTGSSNTAVGFQSLFRNKEGSYNTATGVESLLSSTANEDTAFGAAALLFNTTGEFNTAVGAFALFANNTGADNTANGSSALTHNTTGSDNVALGFRAGNNQNTGSNNVYIGSNILGVAGESNACYIASIFGRTSADGIPVLINSENKLGTATSSKRFKEDIKPMNKASDALLALKPVTFRYKKEIDPAGTSQFGLVAEDVEKVNPNLVVRDKEGKPYSVRYDQVNAMLLNEFLKEHRKVQELEARLAQQQRDFTARLKEQDAKIDKVNARVELSRPVPQTVLNNR
jgi:hypothetical protein